MSLLDILASVTRNTTMTQILMQTTQNWLIMFWTVYWEGFDLNDLDSIEQNRNYVTSLTKTLLSMFPTSRWLRVWPLRIHRRRHCPHLHGRHPNWRRSCSLHLHMPRRLLLRRHHLRGRRPLCQHPLSKWRCLQLERRRRLWLPMRSVFQRWYLSILRRPLQRRQRPLRERVHLPVVWFTFGHVLRLYRVRLYRWLLRHAALCNGGQLEDLWTLGENLYWPFRWRSCISGTRI